MKTNPKSTPDHIQKNAQVRKAVLVCPMTPDEHILKQLTKSFRSETPLEGYLLIGNEKPRLANGIPYLGSAKNAGAVIEKYGITDIYLSLSFPAYKKIHSILTRLVDNSYNVWVLKACISQHTERHSISASINESLTPLTPPQRISKRIFDILLGVALQLLALPLMSIIALAIKLDSPGPIIFKQLRVGQHGRLFQIYKFRTMISGAEEQLGEDLPYDQDGNINHKIPDDPRVTRVGRFLRKTSLDELPQFINVLIGDMSLVGPRPELPIIVAGYQPWQYERFIVPQGLTGWWQVNGRSDRPMHLHTEDDIYYIRNYSFFLDMSIIAKTIWVIVKGIGAY